MAKKTAKHVKHVPQRTCVGCRQTLAKRSLIRIVRTPEGLQVDPTGKLSGRGAYLHDKYSCWERGLKGSLAHALKVELTDQDRETLHTFMANLPKEEPTAGDAEDSMETEESSIDVNPSVSGEARSLQEIAEQSAPTRSERT